MSKNNVRGAAPVSSLFNVDGSINAAAMASFEEEVDKHIVEQTNLNGKFVESLTSLKASADANAAFVRVATDTFTELRSKIDSNAGKVNDFMTSQSGINNDLRGKIDSNAGKVNDFMAIQAKANAEAEKATADEKARAEAEEKRLREEVKVVHDEHQNTWWWTKVLGGISLGTTTLVLGQTAYGMIAGDDEDDDR